MKKRLLSMLLTFAMVLQMVSGVSLAAGYPVPTIGAQDAISKVEAGIPVSVSHRAAWRNGPECSLIAIYASIAMGIDVAELDVKVTSDGVPILMHDTDISRTTTGSGNVENMTWEQLKEYPAEDGQGSGNQPYKLTEADVALLKSLPNYVEHCGEPVVGGTMPTTRLDDAIDLIKMYGPKTMINWDHCMSERRFLPSYIMFRETGMLDNVFFKNSNSASTQLSWYQKAADAWNAKYPEDTITAAEVNESINYVYIANAPSELSKMKGHLDAGVNFVMVEICIGDDTEDAGYLATVEPWCLEHGVAMFVNTMWSGLCSTKADTETTWVEMLDRGYVAIQTDQASELAVYMDAYNSTRSASSVIQAEHFHNFNYDDYGLFVAESADANLNKKVEGVESGDWMEYRNISFDGSEVMLNLNMKGQAVGVLTVYIDEIKAENQIAQIEFGATSGYQLASAQLQSAVAAGNHTLYLQVSGAANTDLVSIDSFQFISSDAFAENTEIDDVVVETEVGVAPVLPSHVNVTVNAGAENESSYGLEVRWEQVAASAYAVEGSFAVLGYVPVLSKYIEATVNVTAGSVITPGVTEDGLVLWLDASEGVTASSAAVSSWTSKVGGSNAITATLKAGSPTLQTNASGGKAGIYFDGNDAFDITMPEDFWNSNGEDANYTVLMFTSSEQNLTFTSGTATGVHGSSASAQENSVMYFGEFADWGSAHFGVAQGQVNWRFGSGTSNDRGDTYIRPASLSSAFTATAVRKQGITDTLFIDGKLIYTGSADRATTANVSDSGWIGMGKNTKYYQGTICEILIYDRALTDEEILAIQAAMAEKYADTISSVADVTAECEVGSAPVLPATVEVTYASGKTAQMGVTWEKINPNNYVAEGTFEVKGTLAGGEEATAKVTVKAVETKPSVTGQIPTEGMMFWLNSAYGVTADTNGKISEWKSKVGDAKAVYKKGDTSIQTDAVAGQPAVVFDGNEDVLQMTLASNAFNGLEAATVIVYAKSKQNVVSHQSGNLGYNVQRNTLFTVDETSAGWGSVYVGVYKDALSARFGTGTSGDNGYYANRTAPVEDYSATVVRWTGSDMAYDIDVDGADVGTGTSKAAKTANNKNVVYLGTGKQNTYWNGEVCEIIFYDRALTDDELANVYKYLEDTYEKKDTTVTENGMLLWLDASDETTLTVNGDGKVTSWKSKVGTYVANKKGNKDAAVLTPNMAQINGKNALTFDGGDVYEIKMDVFNGLTEATIIAYTASRTYWNYNSSKTFEWNVQRGDLFTVNEKDTGWAKVYLGVFADAVAARLGTGTANDNGFRQKREATTEFTTTAVRWTGGSTKTYDVEVNGEAFGTQAALGGTTKNNKDIVYLGAGDDNVCWKGDLCELLIFNRALTDEELESIYNYLDEKYTVKEEAEEDKTVATDGLALWLDASETDTLTTQDGKVSQWDSKVAYQGNTISASVSGTSSMPELTANAVGSADGVKFDGSSDYLNINMPDGFWNKNDAEYTVIMYVSSKNTTKGASTTGGSTRNAQFNNVMWFGESGDWGSVYFNASQNEINWRFGSGVAQDYGTTYVRPSNIGEDYTATVIRKDGTADTVLVDGEQVYSGTAKSANSKNNKNTDGWIGRGKNENGATYFQGTICEILIYDRALTDAEIASINNYLEDKYDPENYKGVTGIYLKEEGQQITLYKEEEHTLTASVIPADADNTGLTYSSSNATVATVDVNGKIVAVGWGYATITVATVEGDHRATCTVFVDKTDSDKIWQNIQDILEWADKQDETEYWNWDETLGEAIETFEESGLNAGSSASDLQAQYDALKEAMKELLNPVEYDFAEGDQGQVAEYTNAEDMQFNILPDSQYLISVQVNGNTLGEDDYDVTSSYDDPYYRARTASAMVITLKGSYLSTLAQGEHTLRVVFADESAPVDIAFRVVCSHLAKSNVNQIKETCTAPGYSGDLVCKIASCGHREQGHTTAPLGHNYVDGVCTRCHEKTASAVISAPTGDLAHPGRWIAALCLTGGMIAALIVARKKEKE
ncbi:MAG: Ig-like domain-containing protein [Lachnospiraceae bacterium]|nr:Ig-like domain-containing protein [Lachnospiraceae bacterium]